MFNPNRKQPLQGEDLLQCLICRILDIVRLPHFSIPNGAQKTYRMQQVFKATGLKAGVPDLFIPKYYVKESILRHGCFIEVKNGKEGKVSPPQKEWHERLRALGYGVFIIRSLEELYALIRDIYPEEAARIRNIDQLALRKNPRL